MFTITDNAIVDAMLAAHKRGLEISVMTDDDTSMGRGSDVHDLAGRDIAARMDRTHAHMHHEFALFDGWTLLAGSDNPTRSAA